MMNSLIFFLLKMVFLASIVQSTQSQGFIVVAPQGCPHHTYSPVCASNHLTYLNIMCVPRHVKVLHNDPCISMDSSKPRYGEQSKYGAQWRYGEESQYGDQSRHDEQLKSIYRDQSKYGNQMRYGEQSKYGDQSRQNKQSKLS